MGGIFKTLRDKFLKTELPYRRMLMVIDLSIGMDGSQLAERLLDSDKDKDLHKKEILNFIRIPAINNALFLMNKGDYLVIDEFNILDELKFIDYMEFNMSYFTDDKNSFRILCKNYISEFGKIVFIADCVMVYNNNINVVLKLVRPDKMDDKKYLEQLEKTESHFVAYEYLPN